MIKAILRGGFNFCSKLFGGIKNYPYLCIVEIMKN